MQQASWNQAPRIVDVIRRGDFAPVGGLQIVARGDHRELFALLDEYDKKGPGKLPNLKQLQAMQAEMDDLRLN